LTETVTERLSLAECGNRKNESWPCTLQAPQVVDAQAHGRRVTIGIRAKKAAG